MWVVIELEDRNPISVRGPFDDFNEAAENANKICEAKFGNIVTWQNEQAYKTYKELVLIRPIYYPS